MLLRPSLPLPAPSLIMTAVAGSEDCTLQGKRPRERERERERERHGAYELEVG